MENQDQRLWFVRGVTGWRGDSERRGGDCAPRGGVRASLRGVAQTCSGEGT